MSDSHIITALFEGLVSQPPDGDSEIAPGVAESWTVDDSQTRFVFKLRQNLAWSDGAKLNARVFVESYERVLNPALGAQNAEYLYDLKNARQYHTGALDDFSQVGVSALSEYELVLELAHPTPYFLQKLKNWAWFPVPTHFIATKGALHDMANAWANGNDCVSNGPYQLNDWQRNQRVILTRNPNYWDATAIQLEQIEFYPFENTQSEHRAFLAGQLDVTEEIPADLKGESIP